MTQHSAALDGSLSCMLTGVVDVHLGDLCDLSKLLKKTCKDLDYT